MARKKGDGHLQGRLTRVVFRALRRGRVDVTSAPRSLIGRRVEWVEGGAADLKSEVRASVPSMG